MFVFNKDLLRLLPPFVITISESRKRAIVLLKEQLNISDFTDDEVNKVLPTWKIYFIMTYIVVFQSRFFQFLVKVTDRFIKFRV